MRLSKILTAHMLLLFCLIGSLPAKAATIYADQVTNLMRGDTNFGSDPEFYGGIISTMTWPVLFTEAEAEAAVLGAPDDVFLTLPGNNDIPTGNPGSAWPYAYVEVGFSSTFTTADKVIINEFGDAAESARVWIYAVGGGFIETTVTQDGSGPNFIIDLSPWSGTFASFDRVGVGGMDELGGATGFDLNAVGVQLVPLPATVWLLGSGLALLFGISRKRAGRKH